MNKETIFREHYFTEDFRYDRSEYGEYYYFSGNKFREPIIFIENDNNSAKYNYKCCIRKDFLVKVKENKLEKIISHTIPAEKFKFNNYIYLVE
ncbi:MAG: hypothetical protein AABY32_00760 [Nanoarchaeota archaeon]